MRKTVVVSLIALPLISVADEESALRLTTGMDFSRGDYGHRKSTEILYIPLSLRYESFPWTAALTVPYLRISGPGGVIGAGDGGGIVIPDSPTGGGSPGLGNGNSAAGGGGFRREEGLGDVIAALTYALDASSEALSKRGLAVDLTGRIKFATADDQKGLGTGEADFALQLDLAKQFDDITPFVTLGHKWMGDPPDTDFENGWFSSLGMDYRVRDDLNVGASFDFGESPVAHTADARELVLYSQWALGKSWGLNAYAVGGFSDASPDYALGLQLTYPAE